ncbi:RelA/SpoT family protein [Quisquiliibacterium transsilvanicum]|uniref:Guanosine-3',5'-bis(Diphosphate) 3'-pyrophosphohydrolase n=1 Tax=Quisquiliibacterium transsilvanicum TaxID=1549638 RepID=A0A7W8HDU1_9BURK|nr:bifunctional (p)ppGpp synthetase/guanosine-3',5'-bis(diphosphate) 3'-pyrophosphohydrolase [Quisquiliibacterium transsilvanicum]MBB5270078.1 guanosine-3',5'-bis(diphosphate) 3'-pyrophosphohydrolase [Quisquiliibacterium transsilvanicum]
MDLSGSRIVAPPVAPATGALPAAKSRAPRRGKHGADTPEAPPAAATFANAPDERQVVSLASLTRLAEAYLPEEDVRRVREAYRVADRAHLGQFRTSGEPYISHPIAVAEICAGWKLDTDSLMAALLHDVLEDCDVSKQQLLERFGPQVADLVDGLTKLDRVQLSSKEEQQAESFRKMLLAMARDVRVILIKLADRLHNMRTLGAVDAAKRRRIARETFDIYAPIANRLGLRKLYLELLDLAFSHRYPMRSAVLRRAMLSARGNRREVLGRILDAAQKALPEIGVKADVYGREKALWGIYEKMVQRRLSFSQVLDVYGFRVIVDTVPQCYLALGALHAAFKPVPGRFKDYIAIPKVNGYQSLHTTLVGPFGTPVEFQIRTREMQRVAESGVAAHWLYKAEQETFTDLQKRTHQWLQSLLDIQSHTGDSLEFMEHVKVDLFPDAVYVFTPKGQIRSLPRGATVIDFAYSVHTDIGDQAVAARVNQEPVQLRTELHNGDVVEVLTDAASRPNPGWLAFVRTGKARAQIRHFLRTMKLTESVELGRRLLEQALASLRIDLDDLDPALFERGARDAGARSLEELYADIGLGKRLAPVAARNIALLMSGKAAATLIMPDLDPIFVNGTEGSAIQYAACCHPLPGDAVVGHLRGGHGLTLHRADCQAAGRQRTKDAERWVEVQWSDDVSGLFRSGLDLFVSDDRGVLGKVAAEIAAAEANIVHISMDEEAEKTVHLRFVVQVRDRVHLALLMRNLRKLPEVTRLQRG